MKTGLIFGACLLAPLALKAKAQSNNINNGLYGFPLSSFGEVVLASSEVFDDLESDFGENNQEPMNTYAETTREFQLGRAVGRLDVATDVGVFPCTAMVLSNQHILTNHHCSDGMIAALNHSGKPATRIIGMELLMNYNEPGRESTATHYRVDVQSIDSDASLDFAVLPVFGNPANNHGTVTLSRRPPIADQGLLVLGHPLGNAKHVSREQCKSDRPALNQSGTFVTRAREIVARQFLTPRPTRSSLCTMQDLAVVRTR